MDLHAVSQPSGSVAGEREPIGVFRDKNEGLRLGAWSGSIPLPGAFHWSDRPIHILGEWFCPSLQLERNWLEVLAKIKMQVGT